jgi:hypothetical protein
MIGIVLAALLIATQLLFVNYGMALVISMVAGGLRRPARIRSWDHARTARKAMAGLDREYEALVSSFNGSDRDHS